MASREQEDYLESIYDLIGRKGHARIKDIASDLGVKPPSVTGMLAKLHRDGLVEYEKYGGARLTMAGRKIGAETREKHEVLRKFLTTIGVPEKIANEDACTMEHSLHKETTNRIKKFFSKTGKRKR